MSEALRVAYLVSRYPATNHTFILREIVSLRSLGFDIQVIAIRGADRPDEAMTALERQEKQRTALVLPFRAESVRAHVSTLFGNPLGYGAGLLLALKLGGHHFRTLVFHLIYFAEAVVAGRAAVRGGYRHLHSHFSSTVALIASRVFGLGLSITIHGPDEFRDTAAFGMRAKVASARFISTISQYARSQVMLASDPGDWAKIEICRLGVDASVFEPDHRAPDHRDPDHFAPDQRERPGSEVFRVVCVGRLAPVKAQRILIAACGLLVSSGWKLMLHLVGSGPDLDALRQFAADSRMAGNVVFEGARNQDEVVALYRQADVFALASFGEGVPVVLMEAMAMELPCVATWVNGIPELIRDREEGLLVAPSDIVGLARAIEELLENPDLRQRLGKAGRLRVLREYDLRLNAQSLAGVFEKYSNR